MYVPCLNSYFVISIVSCAGPLDKSPYQPRPTGDAKDCAASVPPRCLGPTPRSTRQLPPFYDASANAINNHRHHRVNNNHHKANRSVNSSYPQESLGFTIFPINLSKLPPPSHQHSNDKHEKKSAKSSVENSAHPFSKRITDRDAYTICRPRGVVRYHGGPIQVTYIMRDVLSTLISAMSDHQRPHAYNGSNHDVLATNAASKLQQQQQLRRITPHSQPALTSLLRILTREGMWSTGCVLRGEVAKFRHSSCA